MPRKQQAELAKEIVLKENATIKFENRLVNARYTLSELEMKMIIVLAAHIRKNADMFELCSINARQLGEYMNLDKDSAYRHIKATAKKLYTRVLSFEWHEDGCKEASWKLCHWFNRMGYSAKTSELIFQFDDDIEPLLLQVQKAYVQLESKPLMAFKCMYSNRILLWCAEWEKYSPWTIDIDEIRERLQLGKKYTTYKDFRIKVIEPAIAEINALSDYSVTATPNKQGRSYVSYTFTIKRKRKAAPKIIDVESIPDSWSKEQKAMFSELLDYGITQKNAKGIVHQTPLDTIRLNIDYAKKQQQAGKTKDLARYLYSAIAEDYAGAAKIAEEQERQAEAAKLVAKIAAMTPQEQVEYFLRQRQLEELAAQQAAPAPMTDEQREHSRQTGLAGAAAMLEKLKKR